MNLVKPKAGQPEISVTVMLEPLASGRFSASVMEIPTCQAEAETREAAIAIVRQQLSDRLGKAEFAEMRIPVQPEHQENPWLKMFGQFRDSAAFEDVIGIIEAERAALGDEDIDPKFYMPLESEQ